MTKLPNTYTSCSLALTENWILKLYDGTVKLFRYVHHIIDKLVLIDIVVCSIVDKVQNPPDKK